MSMSEPAEASSKAKRIFLTGATGFLGSHLAYALLSRGHRVTALSRGSKSASAQDRVHSVLREVAGEEAVAGLLLPGFERLAVLEGDISQPFLGLSEEALKRCGIVPRRCPLSRKIAMKSSA
jgi:thioester reductase-like protein